MGKERDAARLQEFELGGEPPLVLRPTSTLATRSGPGLRLSWLVYRGPAAAVSFSPEQMKTWMDTRVYSNSPWSPPYFIPEPPPEGKWTAQATFQEPGTYLLTLSNEAGDSCTAPADSTSTPQMEAELLFLRGMARLFSGEYFVGLPEEQTNLSHEFPAFVNDVRLRWQSLRRGLLSDASLQARIDSLAAPLTNEHDTYQLSSFGAVNEPVVIVDLADPAHPRGLPPEWRPRRHGPGIRHRHPHQPPGR